MPRFPANLAASSLTVLRLAAAILGFSFGLIHVEAHAQTVDVTKSDEAQTTCARPGTDQIAAYELSDGSTLAKAINTQLTTQKGNPLSGRGLMVQPDRGNCTTCHAVADIRKKARQADSSSVTKFGLQGTVGPALDGVGSKYTEGELRLLVVNPQKALPKANSIMPAYHFVEARKRVRKECVGRAILTAQEVEDVVAYLLTLKTKKP